ncbi:MAG: response regulator [Prochloraceae cyanobacterium]|nr:response regulator [Prochloraceae cyanobacterium]
MTSFTPKPNSQIYRIFVQETLEFLEQMQNILQNFAKDGGQSKIQELVRAAHTIKGGAAQINLTGIQALAERLEKIFRSLERENPDIDLELTELLLQAYEFLRLAILTQIQTGDSDRDTTMAKAEPIFGQLEAKLAPKPTAQEEPSSFTDLEENVRELILNDEVDRALENLEQLLANDRGDELVEKLQIQLKEFLNLGKFLQISEFVAICQTTLGTLQASPQIARNIGELALAGLRGAAENIGADREIEEEDLSLDNIFSEFNPKIDSNSIFEEEKLSVEPVSDFSREVEFSQLANDERQLDKQALPEVVPLSGVSALSITEDFVKVITLDTTKLMVWNIDFGIYTLPYNRIEDNLTPQPDQIIYLKQQKFLHWHRNLLPIYQLSELLTYNYPLPEINPSNVYPTVNSQHNKIVSIVLVLREGQLIFALESLIEGLITDKKLTIRPFRSPISAPSYICGCTILPDERLFPVIDVAALVRDALGNEAINYSAAPTQLLEEPANAASLGTKDIFPSTTTIERKATILVVDDSKTWRQALRETLQKEGYQVLQAKDGREAIELLKKHSEISLVITDIEMPNLNGFGLLSYCRQDPLLSKVPKILLSTCSSAPHRQLANHLGATAYFTKPYNELEFLAALQAILNDRA